MAHVRTGHPERSLARLEGLSTRADNDVRCTPLQALFWTDLAVVAAVILAVFAGLDWFVMPHLEHWAVAGHVVDLQTPSVLYAKLDYLRRHEGFRAALLGDSVALGVCLRDHGDRDWNDHQLAALLEGRLRLERPGDDPLVMNLAVNGALPADLACLSRLLRSVKPDLVVCDIGLRAFAAEFNAPDKALTREWLARMHLDAAGNCRLDARPAGNWEESFQACLWSHWTFYRLADLFQQIGFDGAPHEWALTLRERFDRWANERFAPARPSRQSDTAKLVLLIKAKQRYANIRIAAGDRQMDALKDFLETAQAERWNLLLFYARESPATRGVLLSPDLYLRLRDQLDGLLRPYLSPSLRFHPGVEGLEASHYLDHVHVDAVGYQRLLDVLWPEVCCLTAGH